MEGAGIFLSKQFHKENKKRTRLTTQPERFLYLIKYPPCVNFICRGITVILEGPHSERGYDFGEDVAVERADFSGTRRHGHGAD